MYRRTIGLKELEKADYVIGQFKKKCIDKTEQQRRKKKGNETDKFFFFK